MGRIKAMAKTHYSCFVESFEVGSQWPYLPDKKMAGLFTLFCGIGIRKMAQNSRFGQYRQLLGKHLALLPPTSAPAIFDCNEQFTKKGRQNPKLTVSTETRRVKKEPLLSKLRVENNEH